MTEKAILRRLKALAKRYARASRLPQHQALDLIARELDFPNWTKLVSASKKDWRPDSRQMKSVDAFVERTIPMASFRMGDPDAMARRVAYLDRTEHGSIGDHAYRLQQILHDIMIAGDGWCIRVPENSNAEPIIETFTGSDRDNPVLDPQFVKAALKLASDRAVELRAEIATDWPRRSTKPDAKGLVRHPLSLDESDVWFCLHCNGKITGIQIAQNLWHCPGCGASPLDIFDKAFWTDDDGRSLSPVKPKSAVDRETPDLQILDGRPKLELSEEKIVLLIRSALLDDAANISERLGALLAEISVDDENDICISLEVDLWPEHKEPVQALTVAELLGYAVEREACWSSIPFAWPGLGEVSTSTSEYTQTMLNAYAQNGGVQNRKA